MFFLGKKGMICPPWQTDPKGKHPAPKHVFGCTERKSTLLRVSCGRIEGTKNKKNKAREGATSPICPLHHHFWRPPYFACASDCWRNHTCQISSESVQGFRSTRGRNWPFALTWHIALTTVYALKCYTVITSHLLMLFTLLSIRSSPMTGSCQKQSA